MGYSVRTARNLNFIWSKHMSQEVGDPKTGRVETRATETLSTVISNMSFFFLPSHFYSPGLIFLLCNLIVLVRLCSIHWARSGYRYSRSFNSHSQNTHIWAFHAILSEFKGEIWYMLDRIEVRGLRVCVYVCWGDRRHI